MVLYYFQTPRTCDHPEKVVTSGHAKCPQKPPNATINRRPTPQTHPSFLPKAKLWSPLPTPFTVAPGPEKQPFGRPPRGAQKDAQKSGVPPKPPKNGGTPKTPLPPKSPGAGENPRRRGFSPDPPKMGGFGGSPQNPLIVYTT